MTSLLKNKNLQKKLSITMLGNVINAAMQWIQISLITKFCSSVQLGLFTLSLSILGPLFVLSGMQLRTVQVTDFNKNWNFSNYFTLRLITNLFVLIILIPYLVNIKTNLLSIFFLLTILKVIESFADVYNGLQQLNDRLHIVSYSLMLRSITTTIAIFIGITVFNNLSLGLLSAAICSLLLLLLFDYRLSKPLIASQKILQFNKKELFALLFKAIPLGVVMFFIYLNSNVSKYFIESYLGTEIQGSYSAISYLIAIGILVDNSIGQTFIYKMAKHYSLNEFSSFSK